MEGHRCSECGRELLRLDAIGPELSCCEDCVPQAGPGSPFARQIAANLCELRDHVGITSDELARRAGLSVAEVTRLQGEEGGEPWLTTALRLADALGEPIDRLLDRVFWYPGEVAPRPAARRPDSERLAGFLLVLAPERPPFDPPPPRGPVTNRRQVAALFGENVRAARERRHLTQETLARAAALSKAGVSVIERGRTETTVGTLLALARALQVPPEVLLSGIVWLPELPPFTPPPRCGGARLHAARSLDGRVRCLWAEGRSAAQIAGELECTPGTVSAIVHRLREQGEMAAYRQPSRRPEQAAARRRRSSGAKAGPYAAPSGGETAEADSAAPGHRDDLAARIGANVASLRRRAGLTLEQLAEAIESDRSHIHRIEKGRQLPSLSILAKLAASLNVRCERIRAGVRWEPSAGAFAVPHQAAIEVPGGHRRLGSNARAARRRLGVAQAALAARAEISRGDVSEVERGKRSFRIFAILRLACALEVDLDELFSGLVDWYVRPLPAPEYAPGDRPPTRGERELELERLWTEGKPEREIAEAFGWTLGAVGAAVRKLRDEGHYLPHRRPARGRLEIAARQRRGARGPSSRIELRLPTG